jgi:hypothetical protein
MLKVAAMLTSSPVGISSRRQQWPTAALAALSDLTKLPMANLPFRLGTLGVACKIG